MISFLSLLQQHDVLRTLTLVTLVQTEKLQFNSRKKKKMINDDFINNIVNAVATTALPSDELPLISIVLSLPLTRDLISIQYHSTIKEEMNCPQHVPYADEVVTTTRRELVEMIIWWLILVSCRSELVSSEC